MSASPTKALISAVVAVAELPSQIVSSLIRARPDGSTSPDSVVARRTVFRIRRAYMATLGTEASGVPAEFAKRLGQLGSAIVSDVPRFVDDLETLVQTAERTFGPGQGTGRHKAAQVKLAFAELVKRRTNNKTFLSSLHPVLADAALELAVDALVDLLNGQLLWVSEGKAAPPQISFLQKFKWPLVQGLMVFALKVQLWLAPKASLDPRMLASVSALQSGSAPDGDDLVQEAVAFIDFAKTHPREIAATVEIVAAACKEAEQLLEMSGADKKAFARQLVLIFLEDEYGLPNYGLSHDLADFSTGVMIDAVVRIFNKRGVIRHRAPAKT